MQLNPKWAAAAAALACVAGPALAANHVDSMGREWAQLTMLTNQSWDQIDSVCQSTVEAPGACNGVLGGVDLTGWTWAGRTEVLALIGEFMVAAGDNTSTSVITSANGYGTNAHAWAAPAIAAFGVTAPSLGSYTFGLTSENYYYAWMCAGSPCGWVSYAAASERFGGQSEAIGAWLYRTAPVPEPTGIALMLTGVGLLAGLQRRHSRRAA